MLRCEALEIPMGDARLRADFEIGDPGLVAVVGASGAGKSTLLMTVAGFVSPLAGRILINSRDVTGEAPGRRPLSVLFQENNLFPHLDAYRNVALGISPRGRLSPDEDAQVRDALDRVGLAGKEHRRPAALSGGEQSRVALARTLVQARPIVLLDEPFAALGPALRVEMLELVVETHVKAGRLVLLVTHEPRDAAEVAGQTIFVADGVAHAPVETQGLFANPPPALAAYLRK